MLEKKVFITGIAGFIGFHLAKKLHELGIFVTGCDNFSPYYDVKLKKKRESILNSLEIKVHEIDIQDTEKMKSLLEKEKITHFVHLAAQAGVRHSLTNPDIYMQTNILGFFKVLELCRIFPSIRLIFASSSSVYGENKKIPFSIDDSTDHPTSLYGATKKSNEIMAYSYHHLFGIPTIGLRFFTVYGPWGRPDMAYFSFTKAILAGEPIDLYNKGEMKRDFTYIDDIVKGTIQAIETEKPWGIYNLGGNHPIPLLSFVKNLEKIIGKTAKVRLLPMQKGDVKETYADLKKSTQDLQFFPKTSIEEGLKHFVDWYKTSSF